MDKSGSKLALVALAISVVLIGYIVHLRGEIALLKTQVELAQKAPDSGSSSATSAADAPAQEPPQDESPAGSETARTITAAQRARMVETLSVGGYNAGSPVWFATIPNNPEAAEFQQQLQSVFEEAGWQVRGNAPIRFNMKPGVYIFAADEFPPEYVGDVNNALLIGGVPIASNGRGYRQYYEERKADNPNWIGFDMAEDQTFVLAIGRNPDT
jgi:hypothetical protein